MEAGPQRDPSLTPETTISLPDEPLRASAALMHETALNLCEPECLYYHSAWQYLRALGIFSTLGNRAVFFVDALSSLALEGKRPRVLVAGSADYSMPAHVFHAYLNSGASLDLTVLDRCQTPLSISRWYAERIGQPIELVQQDLLKPDFEHPYDVIVSSFLLGNFAAEDRGPLFSSLGQRLRTGGKLIVANAVRETPPEPSFFEEAAALEFSSRARLQAVEQADSFGFDPEVVATLALEYARQRRTPGAPSAEGLISLIKENGFEIARFDHVAGSVNPKVPLKGATIAQGSHSALIVATKL